MIAELLLAPIAGLFALTAFCNYLRAKRADGAMHVSGWAASELPIVAQKVGALMASSDPSLTLFYCADKSIPAEIVPAMITFTSFAKPMEPGELIRIVNSHTAAKQNVDGSWSVSPWWLFRAAIASGADPRSLEWRVLLAYPVLSTVSMERGHYLNVHFCNQES